jgi:hypothetical protein
MRPAGGVGGQVKVEQHHRLGLEVLVDQQASWPSNWMLTSLAAKGPPIPRAADARKALIC